jgi:hypothetical protein
VEAGSGVVSIARTDLLKEDAAVFIVLAVAACDERI